MEDGRQLRKFFNLQFRKRPRARADIAHVGDIAHAGALGRKDFNDKDNDVEIVIFILH